MTRKTSRPESSTNAEKTPKLIRKLRDSRTPATRFTIGRF
jgi:hypothetical protein